MIEITKITYVFSKHNGEGTTAFRIRNLKEFQILKTTTLIRLLETEIPKEDSKINKEKQLHFFLS